MKKIHIKLISVVLTLMMSVSVVVASSYAWMVLSSSPVVSGIQVGIGGGNTVLIAPDIREVAEDGKVYHYPGHFSDKMNFNQQGTYDYLKEVGKLNPVSTVNGVDWILPEYYNGDDPEVKQGSMPIGALKDIKDFSVDSELAYANLSAEDKEKIEEGHYVYLDFWVLSPASTYKLRVSTGVEELDGGSFVIDLLQPKENGDRYILEEPKSSAAAAVRVGFLANDLMLTDQTMSEYLKTPYFDDKFTQLRGLYQEPNTGTAYIDANRFIIYEPNGDAHPNYPDVDGMYVETKPLGLQDGRIIEKRTRFDMYSFLTVQRETAWAVPVEGQPSAVEQRFQAALLSGDWSGLAVDEMADKFYGNYLQGQIAPYVKKGGFVQRTDNLYTQLNSGNVSLADQNVGATDDVFIIELERNVPQRIRMFIWLEGQDMDCTEKIAASSFAVNIELACGDE